MTRLLCIRLGAFGDFVLSFGPFAALRAAFPHDRMTLLTSATLAGFARSAPWFDEVLIDPHPAWWQPAGLLRLARTLRRFDRVFDLQTSARSSSYFRLAGRPPWSGIAPGCSHPHVGRARDRMHTRERQREQLELAGITAWPEPDLTWLATRPASAPAGPYALIAPGAAAHRPRKRWPASRFGTVAAQLAAKGLRPVVVGIASEAPLAGAILALCPDALDLTGRTTLVELGGLASGATIAVGNDTGSMHLAAAVGCRCLVLFSAESDPALTAPRGPGGTWPRVLRVDDLADLPATRVADALPLTP